MGRRGITGADVVRAYVTLIREGRVAGPTNIRLELGRGSYSTIASHLKRLALVKPVLPAAHLIAADREE